LLSGVGGGSGGAGASGSAVRHWPSLKGNNFSRHTINVPNS
jgi:hypothetical protein